MCVKKENSEDCKLEPEVDKEGKTVMDADGTTQKMKKVVDPELTAAKQKALFEAKANALF